MLVRSTPFVIHCSLLASYSVEHLVDQPVRLIRSPVSQVPRTGESANAFFKGFMPEAAPFVNTIAADR